MALYLDYSLGQNAATGPDMVKLSLLLFFVTDWFLSFSLSIKLTTKIYKCPLLETDNMASVISRFDTK